MCAVLPTIHHIHHQLLSIQLLRFPCLGNKPLKTEKTVVLFASETD